MKLVYARQFFLFDKPSISLAFLVCLCPFFLGMVKSTYILFVASLPLLINVIQIKNYIAEDSLIFIRMIKPLYCGVALVTLKTFFTFFPPRNNENENQPTQFL